MMVSLPSLWLPIVLSAVFVFIASSIIHMALRYHNNNYAKLPNEEKLLEFMRDSNVARGNYAFPRATTMKEMGSPEMIEKYNKGPVGMMNVMPNGPVNMPKHLLMWFLYSVVISFFVAYVTSFMLGAGTDYRTVFRLAGVVAFLAYAGATASESIWKGQRWSTTMKNWIDGLIYGLVTGGTFGWLWP
jgi:hypothetical protein